MHNEGDFIFYAETITQLQTAVLIRECSGIVCLCLTDEKVKEFGKFISIPNLTILQTSAHKIM